ncbi:MAG: deoxyribodipyrimidine photo-lyase [Granulosicoccus sp.]
MKASAELTGIVWFRQDLRLADNPALREACKACSRVLCLFIDDPAEQTVSQLGEASRVWLHHSLLALDASLQAKGNSLLLLKGDSLSLLRDTALQANASRIYWNRCYDPQTIARDKVIKAELQELQPKTFNAILIFEPWQNLKGDDSPYRVYTPFWRAAAAKLESGETNFKPGASPRQIPGLAKSRAAKLSAGVALDELGLLPDRPWHQSMMQPWEAGEAAAMQRLKSFLKSPVNAYDSSRDLPATSGTSRLSPHLHFGEISPRQILHQLLGKRTLEDLSDGELVFAKEILWREFAYSLIFHFPHTVDEPLDERFRQFPWAEETAENLRAWQRGQTGVPIVDAGMRELYATGWMHNRVRMIVSSYLIKNLLVPWQEGERWFRNTLVDADLASNAMGWQWSAGSGADAAPFFRIFNPVLQGEKFDKQGEYVKQWVPELAEIPVKFVHKPWELPESERLALDYPEPLVDLKATRQRALDAFAKIKGT